MRLRGNQLARRTVGARPVSDRTAARRATAPDTNDSAAPTHARAARNRGSALARAATVTALIGLGAMALPAGAWAVGDTGSISGTVTNYHTGDPVEGAHVCAIPEGGSGTSACTYTDAPGKYEFEGLESDNLNGEEYVLEVSAPGLQITRPVVEVTSGHTTLADEALHETATISGVVTAAGVPLEGARVCAYGQSFEGYECATTGSHGEYVVAELPAGTYKVFFEAPSTCILGDCSNRYPSQYWNAALSSQAAQLVTLAEGDTASSIDAALGAGGSLIGKVTSAATGKPIAGSEVCAEELVGLSEGCTATNAAGEYNVPGLATGSYLVYFSGNVCSEPSAHDVTCASPYPFFGLTYPALVSVTAPATTAQINAALVEVSHAGPLSAAAPVVAGTTTAGSVLTCSQGGWANSPTGFAYQWLRNGAAIAGQTGFAYTVAATDEGTGISCSVTASNPAGATKATSNTLAIPKPAPDTVTITGASVKGSTVAVTLHCTGAGDCTGKLELVVRGAKHGHSKHRHSTVIATGGFAIATGGSDSLAISLNSAASKLLHAAGKKGLKVEFKGTGVTTHTATLK